MFSDNTRAWVILVSLAVVACAACIVSHLIKRRKLRRVAEVAAKAAKLKERCALERELRWSRKQLDMLRFSGREDPREKDNLLNTIAELEKSLLLIADEPEDPAFS